MKKEFPILYAKVSTVIATPILLVTIILYIQRVITRSAPEIYPLVIAAFGVTAALSGVCFRMAPSSPENSTPRYAGEKFLHSALLLIQSLFVIYAKEAIISLNWIHSHETTKTIISAVASGIVFLLSSVAAWAWYYGFSELNSELWQKWKRRIEDINKTEKHSGSTKASEKSDKQSA
jgi:Na+/H+-translocating membrane pyrophosphatase